MKGQIVKISSDLHFVNFENNIYPCKCRGIFRKEHITPVVGDYVLFNKDKKLIEEIIPVDAISVTIEKDLEKGFDYRKIQLRAN